MLIDRFRVAAAEPWPADRPIRFITSFNDVFYEASGRRCVETFREHNPAYELRAYVEAKEEAALSKLEGELADLGVAAVRLSELPLLTEFLEVARDVIPREFGGDAPPEMFPGEGSETGDVWFRKNMYRWFRKIVAIDDAAQGFDDVLFWMDSDCFSTAPLPYSVIEESFGGAGVVFMRANRKHTETGLVGYDFAQPGVHQLVAAMKAHYMTRAFERYSRWDDCITLDLCLERPGAPAARDIARRIPRTPGTLKRVVLHNEVLPTTPFAPYLEHDKGLHSRKLRLVL